MSESILYGVLTIEEADAVYRLIQDIVNNVVIKVSAAHDIMSEEDDDDWCDDDFEEEEFDEDE